ncbi:hypothetical protein V6N13_023085 [Hibiscus sabdariffa]|uniref:Uncharacterized protein n=2 Tax=Hibiscus sabdariffa TaxID=183260 RepID=A0ABR2A836_9ROSI
MEHANQGLQPSAGGVLGRPPDNTCAGLGKPCLEGQVSDLPSSGDVGMVGDPMEETTLIDTVVENSDLVSTSTIPYVVPSTTTIPKTSF